MPIPFLIAGAAAVAGTAGVVKGAKAIQNNAEANQLLESASSLCEVAKKNFETQKEKTASGLTALGNIKINAWSNSIETFVHEFSFYKNVQINEQLDLRTSLQYSGSEVPSQQFKNMRDAALTSKEILRIGAASIGAGAVVGIAVYGGAMMFGKASTGIAISSLSGAAAKNATLAWFGGGAIRTGGLGMAGGKLLLGGIVVAPVLAIAGFVMEAKSKEKLANARMVYAEAKESAEKIDSMTSCMAEIYKVSADYGDFIRKFGKRFQPFINELSKIREGKTVDEHGRVDFNALSEAEQKTLHLAWLMAQIYYQLLASPILNQDGEISEEARPALRNAQQALGSLESQTFKMNGTSAPAANLLWRRKSTLLLVIDFFLVGFLLALCVLVFKFNHISSALLLDAFVAFPLFIKVNDMPESKKYMWRVIKSIVAIVIMLIALVMI